MRGTEGELGTGRVFGTGWPMIWAGWVIGAVRVGVVVMARAGTG